MDNNITVIEGGQKREKGYFDFTLLFLTVCIIAFGVVMIYSASSYNATKYYSDPMLFTRSQIKNVAVGLAAMFMVSIFDYRILAKRNFTSLAYLALILCTVLMVFVVLFGDEHNGSSRWLGIGGFSFQPSEICKVGLIVFVSFAISKAPKRLAKPTGFLMIVILCLPLIACVAIENLSSAIILAGIVFLTCFVASDKKWYYALFFVLGVAAVIYLIFGVGYRAERIEIWLDVEHHEKGGQILQGLYAIASAGLFGRGLGNSMQKLGHVPEAHNDMIFSIICEELGIIGAIVVLFFYILLLWRIYVVAVNAEDLFGSMLCTGVFANIAIQIILNIAVVTNSLPSTGVSLPFISYGGSSMLALCVEIGLVLSVSMRIRRERVES